MKKALHELTDLQLQLLDVIWSRGSATAIEVHEALAEESGLARKTIGTMLARLEKQGVIAHRVEGREFIYRARVTRDEVRAATLDNVLRGLFDGNVSALVSHALEVEGVRPADVRKARELIAGWKEKERK
jgi:predicted transcriptional regulator